MNKTKNECFFVWKNCIFCTYLKNTELFLEWIEVNGFKTENKEGFSQSKDSPQGSLFDAFENNFTGNEFKQFKEVARSALDINVGSIDIIKVSYSFDNGCLNEVPVILLRCKSKKSSTDPNQAVIQQIYLVGVREINEQSVLKHKNVYSNSKINLTDDKSSKFELIKLRVFSFKDQCNINKNNLHVISNFQILYIDESSRTLEIFHQCMHSKNIIIQDFKMDSIDKNDALLSILDIYTELESGLSYVFVSVKNGEVMTILCFLISYANSCEHLTKPVTYEVKQVPLSRFISPDLTQIIKYLQIISISTNVDYSTKSESMCSSLCLLTETGFALKIVNGVIKSVINVKNSFEDKEFTGDNWESSCFKFVSLKECDDYDDVMALQIDTLCCLINWSKEKVVKTWTSVFLISHYSEDYYGPTSLMIVLLTKNTRDDDHSLLFHLHESDILFVSNDEMKEDEENKEENQALNLTQLGGDIQRPMRALLFQQKISEVAVKESESVLQNKISFLISAWKQLSQPFNDSSQFSQVALIPLFHGSTSARKDIELLPKKPHHPKLETFEMWKRTFDNFLIVGLSVKNNFTRPIGHICLKLISYLGNGMQLIETTSHNQEEAGGTCRGHNESGIFLFPGQSCDISCYTDISQSFTGVGITLLLFICYQNVNVDFTTSSLPEYCQQFYSEIVITAEELLNGIFSVEKSVFCMDKDSGIKISLADLQALDAIQSCHTLSVQSVISSVSCLPHKLDQHPFCIYVDITKQYLITGSHHLRMCRVQILNHTNRNELTIKIYTRSDYEALLLVQFLNSLLPEDITIIPEVPTNSYLQDLCGQVLEKTEYHISCIKSTLIAVECPNTHGGSSSQRKSEQCSDGTDTAANEFVLQSKKTAGQEMDSGDTNKLKKTKRR